MDYLKSKVNEFLLYKNRVWRAGLAWMRKNPVPTYAITMLIIVISCLIATHLSATTVLVTSTFAKVKDYANEENGKLNLFGYCFMHVLNQCLLKIN
jgi:hypothetical protein